MTFVFKKLFRQNQSQLTPQKPVKKASRSLFKPLAVVGLLFGVQGFLAGCDSREKNEMTVDIVVKDLKGKTTKSSGTYKQVSTMNPIQNFKMMTPKGEENIYIIVANNPTPENEREAHEKMQKHSKKEFKEGVVTLSEYNQKITSNAAKSITKRWKPRTKRNETIELERYGEKIGTAEVTVY